MIYVELKDVSAGNAAPLAIIAAANEPAANATKSATALYDYDADEANELTFPEGATITDIDMLDEDWWQGSYNGQTGLFPANYVELS